MKLAGLLLLLLLCSHEALGVAAAARRGAREFAAGAGEIEHGGGAGGAIDAGALVESTASVREVVTGVILVVALTLAVINYALKEVAKAKVAKTANELDAIANDVVAKIKEKARVFSEVDARARALLAEHEKGLGELLAALRAGKIKLAPGSPLATLLAKEDPGVSTPRQASAEAVVEAVMEATLERMGTRHTSDKGVNKQGLRSDFNALWSGLKKWDLTAVADRYEDIVDGVKERINAKVKNGVVMAEHASKLGTTARSIFNAVAEFGKNADVPKALTSVLGSSRTMAMVATNALPVISLVSETVSLVFNIVNVVNTYKKCNRFVEFYANERDVFLIDADWVVCRSLGNVFVMYEKSLKARTAAWEAASEGDRAAVKKEWDKSVGPLQAAVTYLKSHLEKSCDIFYRARIGSLEPIREIWATDAEPQVDSKAGVRAQEITMENDKGLLYKAQHKRSWLVTFAPKVEDGSAAEEQAAEEEKVAESEAAAWEKGDKLWEPITHLVQKAFLPRKARDAKIHAGDLDYAQLRYTGVFGNADFELVLATQAGSRQRDAYAEVRHVCERFDAKARVPFQNAQCKKVSEGLKQSESVTIHNFAPPPSTLWGKQDDSNTAPAVVLYYSRQSGAPIVNLRVDKMNRDVGNRLIRSQRTLDHDEIEAIMKKKPSKDDRPPTVREQLEKDGMVWLRVVPAMDKDTGACDDEFLQHAFYYKKWSLENVANRPF
jgi:hypothetical protein